MKKLAKIEFVDIDYILSISWNSILSVDFSARFRKIPSIPQKKPLSQAILRQSQPHLRHNLGDLRLLTKLAGQDLVVFRLPSTSNRLPLLFGENTYKNGDPPWDSKVGIFNSTVTMAYMDLYGRQITTMKDGVINQQTSWLGPHIV